jgi:alkanesulfonate monooxygenase SsuD/methylene tetrahydromethanopterin reductase-like flavin-dependent oxidoreductase (luciferase family)
VSIEGLSRVHVALDGAGSRGAVVALAGLVERLGYGGVWLTEATSRDVFSLLTEIALTTRSIQLGTGITNVFARTPSQLAMAAVSLAAIDPARRVNLGIGASTRVLVEGFHGVPFVRPARRVSEVIDVVRRGVAGESMGYDGEIFALDARFRIDAGQEAGDQVRIFVGGLSRHVLAILGSKADGWLAIWPSRSQFQSTLLFDVRRAALSASRPLPEVAAYLYTGVGSPPQEADSVLRRVLARYICGSGDAYTGLFRRYGYTDAVEEALARWQAGRRDYAAAALPESLLDDLCVRGRPEDVLAALDSFRQIGVDTPVLRFPPQVGQAELEVALTKIASAS